MREGEYEYGLALTSQFYFCSLPIRLDPYSRCLFNCLYCFANARGGKRGDRTLSSYSEAALGRRLTRVLGEEEPADSLLDQFLRHRQPLHIGGMSDPFIPAETTYQVTRVLLELLVEFQYPAIISTKSDLFATDRYLEILSNGNFAIQVSLSSTDEQLIRQVDCGTSGPGRLINAMRLAIGEGVPVGCRIQPLLPGREEDATDVVQACADAGVRHVAVEHLKLPIEKDWRGTKQLSDVLELDLASYFETNQAYRVGREWILPPERRLGRVLDIGDQVRALGMTFGAADTDLLPLGDGRCCCSGADLFPGWQPDFFKHNYAEAVRRADDSGSIRYSSIAAEWAPSASAARWVNSRSRLQVKQDRGASIPEYIRANWSGSPNGSSPLMFHGVLHSDELDEADMRVYQAETWLLDAMTLVTR